MCCCGVRRGWRPPLKPPPPARCWRGRRWWGGVVGSCGLAVMCYCLVPHIPSLTDRSEGATGTSLPWGAGGVVVVGRGLASARDSVPLYRRFLVVGVVLPESGSWERDTRGQREPPAGSRTVLTTQGKMCRCRAGRKKKRGRRSSGGGKVLTDNHSMFWSFSCQTN